MLQGSLEEIQYDSPDKELLEKGVSSPLRPHGKMLIGKDEVTYITDSVSLGRTSYPLPADSLLV